jgi:hypothetical protein
MLEQAYSLSDREASVAPFRLVCYTAVAFMDTDKSGRRVRARGATRREGGGD